MQKKKRKKKLKENHLSGYALCEENKITHKLILNEHLTKPINFMQANFANLLFHSLIAGGFRLRTEAFCKTFFLAFL